MFKARSRWLCISAILCIMSLEACNKLNRQGVPNFRIVDPGVYRGGQPTTRGWTYLKSLGIKTVVKLDHESEGSDVGATKLGMVVVYVPITNFFDARQPIRLAVQTLEDENRWPIYVHCLHGQDRTGLVVGIFRVLHDHYTKSKAFKEMRKNNFHLVSLGLLKVWKDFDGKTLP